MYTARAMVRQAALIGTALLAGCTARPATPPAPVPDTEVRARFADLQAALKSRDPDKLWDMLDSRSRADAERAAKEIQGLYADASADERRKQEEALGVSGTEAAAMTARAVLRTKRFQKKYDEVPESKIEKIAMQDDHATVHYLEPDGDHERLVFTREDGQWQAWLVMPRFKQS